MIFSGNAKIVMKIISLMASSVLFVELKTV